MPWKRKITHKTDDGETTSHVYYINRKLPGLGPEPVCKSLGTSTSRLARRREEAILRLAERGEFDIVRAFLDDRLSIGKIQGEFEQGRVDRLKKRLSRPEESLADAIDDALEVKGADTKQETVDGYRGQLEQFAVWLEVKEFELDEEERDLERPGAAVNIADALADDRAKKYLTYRKKLGRSTSTVNNDRIALSVLTRHAERKGWIEEMPNFTWSRPPVRIRWLEPPQVRAYLAEFEIEERMLHIVLLGTGIRLGEALDLVPGNLRLNQAGRAIIRRAKSDSGVRNPFIPRWVSDRLAEWLAGRNLAPSDPLFTVPRRKIQKHHVDVCQRLGITGQLRAPADEPGEAEANANYTINDHRHTAAVALAREGLPLHMLKEQLGHSTIDMTMRYASFHPAYRDVAPYFDRVGEAWLGDGGSDPFSGGSVTS